MRICAVCGSARNIENAHITDKGMGGRGSKAPDGWDDTAPLCAGTGGNTDPTSCHGAHHHGLLALRQDDRGVLWVTVQAAYAKTLRRRGVKIREGWEAPAQYQGKDSDEIFI